MGTELSIAPAAWTCDLMSPAFKTVRFASSGNLACLPVFQSRQVVGGLPQHAQGLVFVCHYPRLVAFGGHGNSCERVGDATNLLSP